MRKETEELDWEKSCGSLLKEKKIKNKFSQFTPTLYKQKTFFHKTQRYLESTQAALDNSLK